MEHLHTLESTPEDHSKDLGQGGAWGDEKVGGGQEEEEVGGGKGVRNRTCAFGHGGIWS